MSYLDYDVITIIDRIHENLVQFPAITFCNLKRKNSKYNLNETIITCGFSRNKCSTKELNWFFDPVNGLCSIAVEIN